MVTHALSMACTIEDLKSQLCTEHDKVITIFLRMLSSNYAPHQITAIKAIRLFFDVCDETYQKQICTIISKTSHNLSLISAYCLHEELKIKADALSIMSFLYSNLCLQGIPFSHLSGNLLSQILKSFDSSHESKEMGQTLETIYRLISSEDAFKREFGKSLTFISQLITVDLNLFGRQIMQIISILISDKERGTI